MQPFSVMYLLFSPYTAPTEHSLSYSLIFSWIFFTFVLNFLSTSLTENHHIQPESGRLLCFTFFHSLYAQSIVSSSSSNSVLIIDTLCCCSSLVGVVVFTLLCVCVVCFALHARLHSYACTLPRCEYMNKVRSNFHSFFPKSTHCIKAFSVLTHRSNYSDCLHLSGLVNKWFSNLRT